MKIRIEAKRNDNQSLRGSDVKVLLVDNLGTVVEDLTKRLQIVEIKWSRVGDETRSSGRG